jgi:hypothetical protein
MTIYEEYATNIILLAYSKGGVLTIDEIKSFEKIPEEYRYGLDIQLKIYGSFGDGYTLNKDGLEFARNGAFKGEEDKRNEDARNNKETRYIAIAGVMIAFISLLASIGLHLFRYLCF